METITVNLDQVNYEKAIDFLNVYEYEMSVDCSTLSRKTFLGDLVNRSCRFCGKTIPEITFKKKAHIVPQFIGNRHLLSAFECDTCNKFFGDLYEKDFANFIGALRPFQLFAPSKNNRNPKHKEIVQCGNEQKVKLSIQAITERNLHIIYEHPYDQSIAYDKENNKLTINATRSPYIPLYVYKMLLKMALSFVNEEEIHNYKQSLMFLMNNTQNDKFKEFPLCHVYMHSLYGKPIFTTPVMYLYRKKDHAVNSPSKTFILFTGNHVYQIFIPLNKEDDWIQGQTVRLFPYPLLFDRSLYEKGFSYSAYGKLMDSNERKIGELQQLTFTYKEAFFNE